ncbi:hypothetical protein [Pedobacter miscanthi]|uniref:Uncharacterized protein n=1 Tax=Pedobacter miscanthi TaxID=2259170 RepID=A0A366LC87_9SPHI|nr:hypothetical protein [Pedobacter miscanthi]RBQ11505.1 hypothetical protein DRW42_03315 [Pedobacter miscanthi]
MIYLSAQPDSFYFLWQIKLLLNNLNRLGVASEHIHVLIAYDITKGLSPFFSEFISANQQASFFCYGDTRRATRYASSIRPHIIAKHFHELPWLESDVIFYHDSDIIFTKLPHFGSFTDDPKWYGSDTASYTGPSHLKKVGGEELFEKMCQLVGVPSELIVNRSHHSGGAQYILKSLTSRFWSNLEENCEKMFNLISEHNEKIVDGPKLQAWCADIWCLWWEAARIGVDAETHPELDFLWANDPIDAAKMIVHYTGSLPLSNKCFFRKNNYHHCTPFFDDFSHIDRDSASFLVIREIAAYVGSNLVQRMEMLDVTMVILCQTNHAFDVLQFQTVLKYLQTNIDCDILVLEVGVCEHVSDCCINENVKYYFVPSHCSALERAKIIPKINSNFIIVQSYNIFISIEKLANACGMVKAQDVVVVPYTRILQIDTLFHSMFAKLLDIDLFTQNEGKMLTLKPYGFDVSCMMGGKIYLTEILDVLIDDQTDQSTNLGFLQRVLYLEDTAYRYVC